GRSPAVPTRAPRRSVTRARAAGASSPVTVTRTRLLRPSGCRYRAVGTARRTGVGEAARGHRSAVVRVPSQATKLRRSVRMVGLVYPARFRALDSGGPAARFSPAQLPLSATFYQEYA